MLGQIEAAIISVIAGAIAFWVWVFFFVKDNEEDKARKLLQKQKQQSSGEGWKPNYHLLLSVFPGLLFAVPIYMGLYFLGAIEKASYSKQSTYCDGDCQSRKDGELWDNSRR